jgi:hypothetical protein
MVVVVDGSELSDIYEILAAEEVEQAGINLTPGDRAK